MPTETSDHQRDATTGAETARKENISPGLKFRFFFSFVFLLDLL